MPGSQIYSGSGAPSTIIGTTGDYYLDVVNYVLYGPKTVSGWGTGIVLKGATGTANVIYSAWAGANNLRDTVIDLSHLNIGTLPAAALDQADLNSASIQVYFRYDPTPHLLPYITDAGGTNNIISFLPEIGVILITRYTLDNSGSILLSSTLQYRYVIIPGGVEATSIRDPYGKDYTNPRQF